MPELDTLSSQLEGVLRLSTIEPNDHDSLDRINTSKFHDKLHFPEEKFAFRKTRDQLQGRMSSVSQAYFKLVRKSHASTIFGRRSKIFFFKRNSKVSTLNSCASERAYLQSRCASRIPGSATSNNYIDRSLLDPGELFVKDELNGNPLSERDSIVEEWINELSCESPKPHSLRRVKVIRGRELRRPSFFKYRRSFDFEKSKQTDEDSRRHRKSLNRSISSRRDQTRLAYQTMSRSTLSFVTPLQSSVQYSTFPSLFKVFESSKESASGQHIEISSIKDIDSKGILSIQLDSPFNRAPGSLSAASGSSNKFVSLRDYFLLGQAAHRNPRAPLKSLVRKRATIKLRTLVQC
ncbi:hypothetical protein DSO57_1029204 [Entomophthora muscae]|uniref:Uncharacterized protein n=1 Tax=Entomophthora muscae TaxID=34485 RepID=A0ACC2SQD9_9FUNG|nr:hypothetical protein DSO57_1029204 [Entomophthora muscae]